MPNGPNPTALRLTILTGAFLPVPAHLGGAVEKLWWTLAREFARRGHRVTLVSRLWDGLPPEEDREGVLCLRVRGHDTPASLIWLKALDLAYTIRATRAVPPSDFIVTNTFWAPLWPPLLRRGPLCVDVERMPKGQMRLYGRATRLRAPSSAVATAIAAEAPRLCHRIRVIPNPLPFVPDSGDTLENLLSAKENIILYAGRLHPEKGLDLLLDAYRRMLALLPQVGPTAPGDPPPMPPSAPTHRPRLVLAGPWETARGGGGPAYRDLLADRASGLPVDFPGPLDDPALHALYRRAALFVYPSLADRGESFGLAPLEAMAFGAVPVVSHLACFRDFITPEVNGLVFDHRAPDASDQLATALSRLTSSPSLRSTLATRALQVRSSHSPAIIAKQFLDHILEI